MMTQLGRVVYDRKKNVMRPRDLARIIDSYSRNLTGSQFGEFCLNILELTMNRRERTDEYRINFWRYLLNAFSRGALEELFTPRLPGTPLQTREKVAKSIVLPEEQTGVQESPEEYKRRRIREGLDAGS